ncbi:hypothetical protein RclHR1_05520014 [Rhizophagus clarus]|uniref:Uncharacterized protein n=1 Tax=Rhizophagus clarus TaxID=94130 RepID=A0A2Z6RMU9_9GLOM|nr:hypothetical protein RclHR1_05520014 [Rhizophagus clarus]
MFHGPIFNIKHFCIVLYSIREDTVFRYYDDMDTLSVYFAKASSGVIRYSEANDYILVSYYGDDKIISVEIYKALLCCHLFETSETIDNKPPLSFYPICYEVLLVSSKPSLVTFKETEDKVSEVGINDKNEIVTLLFYNASGRLMKCYQRMREKNLQKKRG